MSFDLAHFRYFLQGFICCTLSPLLLAEASPTWIFDGDLSERARANAEVLAMRETKGLELDAALLSSVESDLKRIYAFDASLASPAARHSTQMGAFMATVTPEVDALLEEGSYLPWSDLQAELGEGSARRIARSWAFIWVFELDPKYNPQALVERIRTEWDGVESVSANAMAGDGPDLYRQAALDWYVFSLAWGDCPSGCIHREYRIVAMAGAGRDPEELSPDAARDLFQVVGLDLNMRYEGALGDVLTAPTEAMLQLKANPQVRIPAHVEWVRAESAEGPWTRWGRSLSVSEDLESYRYGFRVSLPQTDVFLIIEQEVSLLEAAPPYLVGERRAGGWVKHATGWVNDSSAPWLYHSDHGWWWVHPTASDQDSWVIWEQGLGWTVLNLSDYPLMYSFGEYAGWLYYLPPSRQPRLFYDMSEDMFIEIE